MACQSSVFGASYGLSDAKARGGCKYHTHKEVTTATKICYNGKGPNKPEIYKCEPLATSGKNPMPVSANKRKRLHGISVEIRFFIFAAIFDQVTEWEAKAVVVRMGFGKRLPVHLQ